MTFLFFLDSKEIAISATGEEVDVVQIFSCSCRGGYRDGDRGRGTDTAMATDCRINNRSLLLTSS